MQAEVQAVGRARVDAGGRTFAVHGVAGSPALSSFVERLAETMAGGRYRRVDAPGPDTNVVLHVVDAASPRPFRRKAAPVFVIALAELPTAPVDTLRAGYPVLVRALANLCVLVVGGGREVRFVTLEQGCYGVGPDLTDDELVAAAYARMDPLASSRLVIDNEFVPDLPRSLWDGDEQTGQIRRAGARLDALDLLPAPMPLDEILPPRDLRHVRLLFGIGGLSYGNVSARYGGDAFGGDQPVFWMSASGVDKADLSIVGEHVLLVRRYDSDRDRMVLSVPPDIAPRRVSVAAIEHWMIYREHPGVGAILHVHGWIDGTPSTEVGYPCGTVDLAGAVAELVRLAPDPSRAVVGQRNHGLTITGHSLDEIFARVGDAIVPRVPMG